MPKNKLKPVWIEKINVSNFFNVEYILWDKLNQAIGYEDVFTDIFLSLIIMISSMILFLISRENRLVCIMENKKIQNSDVNKLKPIFE